MENKIENIIGRPHFKKDDSVICLYEYEELIGTIVQEAEGGYIVDLLISHYTDGRNLRQHVFVPYNQIRPLDLVAQAPIRHKKPEKTVTPSEPSDESDGASDDESEADSNDEN